ncbi:arginine--tRNA ligase, partial [bacterium]|nr:arginine--tRNA ligase [bacterium]
RQGENDEGILNSMLKESVTKPTLVTFEGDFVLTIKEEIETKLTEIIKEKYPEAAIPFPPTEPEKNPAYGDLSSNIAFLLSKFLKKPPEEIAKELAKSITGVIIEKAEPVRGFVNIWVSKERLCSLLPEIEEKREGFGRSNFGEQKKVLLEFVSANPTGPLHIGHGRGAVYGDVLANILSASGFLVKREYYVNDTGNQIETLGGSVKHRYLELFGEKTEFPQGGYCGEYITDIAKKIQKEEGEGAKEQGLTYFGKLSSKILLSEIQRTLQESSVHFDSFFYESSLYESGKVEKVLADLSSSAYKKDGALWLETSKLSDEKDRVLVREDSRPTYYVADLAYHRDKFERGYDLLINLWGTDHHGYVERIKSGLKFLGYDPEMLNIILYQLVTLRRGKELVSMSTRKGEFITLDDVVREVGPDATRFFLLMRKSDAHLEFDLELAKKESSENPVYYVQYLHARCSSILREAETRKIPFISVDTVDLSLLSEPEEHRLMAKISLFPDEIKQAAKFYQPHRIPLYLMELAGIFHNYYHFHRVLSEDRELSKARLVLVNCVKTVVGNGLNLLGISAPEKM